MLDAIDRQVIASEVLRRCMACALSRSIGMYIPPSLWSSEAELWFSLVIEETLLKRCRLTIRRDADHVAIFFMNINGILRKSTASDCLQVRYPRKCGEFGPGKIAKWVEANAVYTSGDPRNKDLFKSQKIQCRARGNKRPEE